MQSILRFVVVQRLIDKSKQHLLTHTHVLALKKKKGFVFTQKSGTKNRTETRSSRQFNYFTEFHTICVQTPVVRELLSLTRSYVSTVADQGISYVSQILL